MCAFCVAKQLTVSDQRTTKTTFHKSGVSLAGTTFAIIIGGYKGELVLSDKLKGDMGNDKISLSCKQKKKVIQNGYAKFRFSTKKQSLLPSLYSCGFLDEDVKSPVSVDLPVAIRIGDKGYATMVAMSYRAKKDKTGKGKAAQ